MSQQVALPPVLVLFGGRSAESDVSVISGTAIAAALLDAGVTVTQAHIARDGALRPLPAGHRRGDLSGGAYTDLTAPALLGVQAVTLESYLASVAASASEITGSMRTSTCPDATRSPSRTRMSRTIPCSGDCTICR